MDAAIIQKTVAVLMCPQSRYWTNPMTVRIAAITATQTRISRLVYSEIFLSKIDSLCFNPVRIPFASLYHPSEQADPF